MGRDSELRGWGQGGSTVEMLFSADEIFREIQLWTLSFSPFSNSEDGSYVPG